MKPEQPKTQRPLQAGLWRDTLRLPGSFFWGVLVFLAACRTEARGEPFWKSSNLVGDPLFFIQAEGGEPRAQLLCVPASLPVLTDSGGRVTYQEGRDYVWKAATREIILTKGTRIPFRTVAELHPPAGAPDSDAFSRDGKSRLFRNNEHLLHQLQTFASYPAVSKWTGPVPSDEGLGKFPHLQAKLRNHAAISLVVLGDSVSTGLNASRDVPPFQPGYVDLVAAGLERMFGSKVKVTNISLSGKRSPWGLEQADTAIAADPDLLVCAFGINDATDHVSPEKFSATIAQILDKVRRARPECDFVLVSTLVVNPEWDRSDPSLYSPYATALGKLARTSPTIAFADVNRIWVGLLEKKTLFDLTGNGLCHPNDFGHRVYADVILSLFTSIEECRLEVTSPPSG